MAGFSAGWQFHVSEITVLSGPQFAHMWKERKLGGRKSHNRSSPKSFPGEAMHGHDIIQTSGFQCSPYSFLQGTHDPSLMSLCPIFFPWLSCLSPLAFTLADNLASAAHWSKNLSSRNFPVSWYHLHKTTLVLPILVAFPPGHKKTSHVVPLVLDKPDQEFQLRGYLKMLMMIILLSPCSLLSLSSFHLALKYISISLPRGHSSLLNLTLSFFFPFRI